MTVTGMMTSLGDASWDSEAEEAVNRAMPTRGLHDSSRVKLIVGVTVPFGRAKTPVSEPFRSAVLKCEVKTPSETLSRLLLACTYFLMAWRL